ncbi:DUF2125 domain-containing protein [Acetobacter persici]|uniref:DUF2125 domain-containing protein n=1 Tax=Acetobacter persici TaxID=1076596 RepID=UPI001BA8177F|nr:DUF2125 domain-containing protein [Acetobacter persici]
MRKVALWLGCGCATGLVVQTALWWGGIRLLEQRLLHVGTGGGASIRAGYDPGLNRFAGRKGDAAQSGAAHNTDAEPSGGCLVVSQTRKHAGWPFRARVVLEAVRVTCAGVSGGAGLSYAVRQASLELALWHPLTVQGTLEGGQAFASLPAQGSGMARQGALLLRTDGAPLRISLPLRAAQTGAVRFSTDFLHLVPQRGAAEAHPVTARGVSGTLVWNSHATTQASALALSFTAQRAVVAPWAESVDAVQGAVAIPGPADRLAALWDTADATPSAPSASSGSFAGDAALLPQPADASQSAGPAEYTEILVQHLAGRWRGLGVSWSGRLVMAPGGAPLGETWLTLSAWRPFLARLQQDKTLSPAQMALLSRLTDQLEARTGGTEGPLSVPLQVRDGAVQFAGVPLLSVLATLHGASLSGAGTP